MKTVVSVVLTVALVAAITACGGKESDSDGPSGSVNSAVGPGISISEALSSDLSGPLLVNGFLLIKDGDVRLCSALAESFPPQCSGPSLQVKGFDAADMEGLESQGGASWSAEVIQLLGEVDGDVITISPNTSA